MREFGSVFWCPPGGEVIYLSERLVAAFVVPGIGWPNSLI
jgi:hypothetical protein